MSKTFDVIKPVRYFNGEKISLETSKEKLLEIIAYLGEESRAIQRRQEQTLRILSALAQRTSKSQASSAVSLDSPPDITPEE